MASKECQVIFVCKTCEDINKSRLGLDRFEPHQTEFEDMSDAYQHCLARHFVVAHVIIEDDNDSD